MGLDAPLPSPADEEAAQEVAESIGTLVAGGSSVEGAVRRLRWVPPHVLDRARQIYDQRRRRIRALDDTGVLTQHGRQSGSWYAGPRSDGVFWPALRQRLLAHGGLDEDAVTAVHSRSDLVVSFLEPPGSPTIRVRGLVLGYVQSGKTTNFMSVIAKAADAGYRMIIVLSGVTENLRAQTQARLERMLVGDLEDRWHLLTDIEGDFAAKGNARNLLSNTDHRLLAVVKKNPHRLRRLRTWLEQAGREVMATCPILLIDDEADQASIDVGLRRRSRINGLIRQILENPKAAYVAYTATPFANLLIDPSDAEGLYPRDFIVDLPRPDDYFGPERLFGREPLTPDEDESVSDGLDVVRSIPEEEAEKVRPPRDKDEVAVWEPELVPSLVDALHWFVLAAAARRARPDGGRHTSMLIHTSMRAEAHFKTAAPVERLLGGLRQAVGAGDQQILGRLRSLWERESERLPSAAQGLLPVAWDDLAAHLPAVLDDITVVVDNYLSKTRLSYDSDGRGITAVVIGGNTLSRGLTLEGLVCSYFVRSASAYDTLLQMGRWFGYKPGYSDLPRLWMTDELQSWFFDLATVEEEIRREIRQYEVENLRPDEVPVKIRTHPAMTITSAAKMRHAVEAEISFSGQREQTILFNHSDKDWLLDNQRAARRLLGRIGGPPADLPGRRVFRNVPAEVIDDFLAEYHFHEKAYRMKADLLRGYLAEQNSQGYLRTWNVVVMDPKGASRGIDLGLDRPVGLLTRSRLDLPNIQYANIKALVSTIDRVADLDEASELQGAGLLDDRKLLAYREDRLGDVGLLCLYPIDRESQPRNTPKGRMRRVPMEAVEDVIGVGIFFPTARGQRRGIRYMSADLSRVPREPDDVDVEAIDKADEQAGQEDGNAGRRR